MRCMPVQHYSRNEVMPSMESITAGDATDTDTRKLVILGLPWDTTEASLEQYFSQLGPLQVICLAQIWSNFPYLQLQLLPPQPHNK